ncbi:hypothetical protein GCM10011610_19830 [Nocardia rhizosphaerihabitans]|uniref:Uncharacterized protein n=1 Tax=Nocardia rhizosphaerihabitans TaxID=1691570 RepID=A0ABQ2K8P1_9NOCA|nr:hypothetical protein GCM10011610_19830 [Nocardia rhizosphaerihabitans]
MESVAPGSAPADPSVLLPPHRQDGGVVPPTGGFPSSRTVSDVREKVAGEARRDPMWIEYADFGERFVTYAVTEERIAAAVAGMTGRGVTIGPFSLGPAGLAGFVAEGTLGTPVVTRNPGDALTFGVRVPLTLAVNLVLGGRKLGLAAVVEIGLTLHARTAQPLLVVIDVAPVTARDVSFTLRAEAIDTAWEMLLDPIAGLVQREVANRVNAIVGDPKVRSERVFDIEAILDGYRSPHRHDTVFEWIDFREFGLRFFADIVTRDRVHDVVAQMAGSEIAVGPLSEGPRGAATVTVRGAIEQPRVIDRGVGEPGAARVFDMTLPVGLDITVDVLKANHYRADLEIPLVLTARAAEPLQIVIDVPPPALEDISMEFTAKGLRAATLARLAGIKRQVVAQVVAVVSTELADPTSRTIDVGAAIDSAT